MHKARQKVLAIVIAIVAFVACGEEHKFQSGSVTQKTYREPYSYTTLSCAMYGKYGCSVYVPITHNVGPAWFIWLKNCDVPKYEGKCLVESWQVSEGDWHNASEGDWLTMED